MRFEFASAGRIVFGKGVLQEAGGAARAFGTSALVVTGQSNAKGLLLQEVLEKRGVEAVFYSVPCEPTVERIRQGIEIFRRERLQMVIGIGGGSVIDAAKAIAGLAPNPGDAFDYLEVVGRGKPLTVPAIPLIAIPTTAGTGAEVTRNAVLNSPEHGVKASLRSPFLMPLLALVDPELTYSLPPANTAASGLDALTQLIEPFVSPRANLLTDILCREGIPRAARALRRAWANGRDEAAREDMALASLFGGLALANAGLGAVHGLASPLGGQFHAPHGAICAALLASVMAMNVRVLRETNPAHPSLDRYAQAAVLLTGDAAATIEDSILWVRRLCEDLRVPRLSSYGIEYDALNAIAEKGAQASSMKANPVALSSGQLLETLREAM